MPTARYALTDAQWVCLHPLLPAPRPTGRPPADPRRMVEAALWVLHAGAPWRDLPDRFGPWQTAYHRFNQYRKDGTWDRVVEALQRAADLDHAQWNVDGTVVRAARPAAGAKKKSGPAGPG